MKRLHIGILMLCALLALLVGANLIRACSDAPNRYAHDEAPASTGDDPLTHMTAAEHLAEAKKALNETDFDPDPMKRHWGRVTDAEKHLAYIHVNDPEFDAALGLLAEKLPPPRLSTTY